MNTFTSINPNTSVPTSRIDNRHETLQHAVLTVSEHWENQERRYAELEARVNRTNGLQDSFTAKAMLSISNGLSVAYPYLNIWARKASIAHANIRIPGISWVFERAHNRRFIAPIQELGQHHHIATNDRYYEAFTCLSKFSYQVANSNQMGALKGHNDKIKAARNIRDMLDELKRIQIRLVGTKAPQAFSFPALLNDDNRDHLTLKEIRRIFGTTDLGPDKTAQRLLKLCNELADDKDLNIKIWNGKFNQAMDAAYRIELGEFKEINKICTEITSQHKDKFPKSLIDAYQHFKRTIERQPPSSLLRSPVFRNIFRVRAPNTTLPSRSTASNDPPQLGQQG